MAETIELPEITVEAGDEGFSKIESPDAGFVKTKPTKAKEETPISATDEIKRVLSSINEEGIASTLGAPVDLANALLKAAGIPVSKAPFAGSESIKSGMRSLGMSFPEPQSIESLVRGDAPETKVAAPRTTVGKIAASAGKGIAEVGLGGMGTGAAVKGVGKMLNSPATKRAGEIMFSPGANMAAGAGAGTGGEVVSELTGDSKVGRTVGELIGGLAGGAVKGVASVARSSAPVASVNPVLDAYERLNLAPSLAEASKSGTFGGRALQWLEGNVLPQTLGGGGVMEKFKMQRQREMTNIQQDIAEAYGTPRTREQAGKSIQDSVTDTWLKAKKEAGDVIEAVTSKYANEVVYADNLINAATNPVGAATTRAVRATSLDPAILEAQNLIRETGGNFSFADLKALRTKIGGLLEPGFQKNVNDAQVDQLYKALSKDMEQAVKSKSPNDFAALQEANSKYAAAQTEFKQRFKKLIGTKNVPVSAERAFDIVTGAASEKGRADLQEFRHVWDALPKTEQGNLASTILSRLGAMDKGDVRNPETFSLGNFLRGYRELSSEAKDLLFKSTGNKKVAQELDDLLAVQNNINEKLAKLASTSKSGSGALIGGQMLGALGGLDGLLLTVGGPYVAAQIMTNPTAIKALRGTLKIMEESIDASIRAGIAMNVLPQIQGAQIPSPIGSAQAGEGEFDPASIGAQQAPDGHWYLPPGSDPANPEKHVRVDPPQAGESGQGQ